MIHPDLLDILCCPETRQPVREASPEVLESVNRARREESSGGGPDGAEVEMLTGGLLREDGKFLYPVRNGIPIMLIEERIAVPSPADAEPDAAGSGEDVEEDGDPGHHPVEAGAGS